MSLPVTQDSEALSAAGGRQPGPDATGLGQLVDVLEQSQPASLGDVGRVGVGQTVSPSDRPDQVTELLDQGFPGMFITTCGGSDETARIRFAGTPPYGRRAGQSLRFGRHD
jgi:hypothetical protein